jgi:hypothetical protein
MSVCSNESDDWEDCYAIIQVDDGMVGKHKHLQQFKPTPHSATHYFQTYGGGPEGGYFYRVRIQNGQFISTTELKPTNKISVEEVYKVERDWGKPFTVERLVGASLEERNVEGITQVRLVWENSTPK